MKIWHCSHRCFFDVGIAHCQTAWHTLNNARYFSIRTAFKKSERQIVSVWKSFSKKNIIQKLREVGLQNGDIVMVHTSLKKWAMSAAGTDRNRSLDGSRRKKRINHDAHAIMEKSSSRRRRSWGRRPERLGFDSGELARIRQDTDAHQHNGSRSRDVSADAGQHPKRPSRKVCLRVGKTRRLFNREP